MITPPIIIMLNQQWHLYVIVVYLLCKIFKRDTPMDIRTACYHNALYESGRIDKQQ